MRSGIVMTVRIYAALTIALACSVGACSTSPSVPGAQASSSLSSGPNSEGNPKLAAVKGNGDGSADVTGSIPPKETSKSPLTGNAGAAAKLRVSGREFPQQSGADAARLPDLSRTAARKFDEPLYRPTAPQTAQAQQPSAIVAQGGSSSGDPANAMALASLGTVPTRNVVVASIQPVPSRSESI